MTATTVKSICVWSDSGVVGDLRFLANGTHLFEYRAEWLAKEGAWAISPHFPLAERSFSGERVYNFFDNLLPEGGRRKIISNCPIPDDHIDEKRYPLFVARRLLRELSSSWRSTGRS